MLNVVLQGQLDEISVDGSEEFTRRIKTLQEKWNNSQAGLINGSQLYQIDGVNSPEVQQMYHQLSPSFLGMNEVINALLASNTVKLGEEQLKDLVHLEEEYNTGMMEVHSRLIKEQEASIKTSRTIGWVMAILALGIFILAFVLIIRPTVTKIESQSGELISLQEALARSSVERDGFIAELSNELVQPVNHIIGYANMLDEASSIEAARKISRSIKSSAENLSRLLGDMADYTLIHENALELDQERFNLRSMLEEVMENMKTSLSGKPVELILDLDPRVRSEIIQDKYRLQQVLRQLLENAMQFTEKGEIVLRVENVREEYNFLLLKFSVKDTGVGFDVESNNMFDVSSNRSISRSNGISGTSLGLAICKMLVEAMGGKIWVESKPLKGSTFYFTVVAEVSEVSHAELLSSLGGVKALVVDDNKTNLKILVKQLSTWGIQATPFNSPELVAELIGNLRKFDICLIDLEMPEMDGRQLARKIRDQYPSADFPLIALSSANKPYIENQDSLFTSYITKPVKQSQLLDTLVSSLGNKRTGKMASSEVHSMHNGLRVLIAQDNELMRAVAAKTLKTLGCTYENASSGKQIIEKVGRADYDLLLVDLSLPDVDKVETMKKIKQSFHGKSNPVIIGLSDNESRDRQVCIKAGMDDCMNYAVRTMELEEKIHRFFEDHHD